MKSILMMTYREPRHGAAREGAAVVSKDEFGNYAVDGVKVEGMRTLTNGYTGLTLSDNKTTYVLTAELAQLEGL